MNGNFVNHKFLRYYVSKKKHLRYCTKKSVKKYPFIIHILSFDELFFFLLFLSNNFLQWLKMLIYRRDE